MQQGTQGGGRGARRAVGSNGPIASGLGGRGRSSPPPPPRSPSALGGRGCARCTTSLSACATTSASIGARDISPLLSRLPSPLPPADTRAASPPLPLHRRDELARVDGDRARRRRRRRLFHPPGRRHGAGRVACAVPVQDDAAAARPGGRRPPRAAVAAECWGSAKPRDSRHFRRCCGGVGRRWRCRWAVAVPAFVPLASAFWWASASAERHPRIRAFVFLC